MKYLKYLKYIFVGGIACISLTGCFKRDTLDDITIYTTTYPIQYIADKIYGYNSKLDSIYPNGVDTKEYSLTDKQIKEYAEADMFIYNGLTKEKKVAAAFVNKNNNIKIIDVTHSLSIKRDEEELWLCPANYLMLAQNIKNGINEYATSTVLKQTIENNYDDLKLIISKYDAELKIVATNSANKTIIVGNDVFEFLEDYGFEVYSIEEQEGKKNDFQLAKNNVTAKKNSYVFILDTDDEKADNVQKLVTAGAKVVKIKSMRNLDDEEVRDGTTYETMMNDFIEKLKEESYN